MYQIIVSILIVIGLFFGVYHYSQHRDEVKKTEPNVSVVENFDCYSDGSVITCISQ